MINRAWLRDSQKKMMTEELRSEDAGTEGQLQKAQCELRARRNGKPGTSEMCGQRGKCLIKGMADTKEQMCEVTEDNSLKGKGKPLGFHEYPSLPAAKVIRVFRDSFVKP